MRGANRLAIEALPLFPVMPKAEELQQPDFRRLKIVSSSYLANLV